MYISHSSMSYNKFPFQSKFKLKMISRHIVINLKNQYYKSITRQHSPRIAAVRERPTDTPENLLPFHFRLDNELEQQCELRAEQKCLYTIQFYKLFLPLDGTLFDFPKKIVWIKKMPRHTVLSKDTIKYSSAYEKKWQEEQIWLLRNLKKISTVQK